jgi:hypothetical protein
MTSINISNLTNCNPLTETGQQKWICCKTSTTQTTGKIVTNANCQPVDNYTTKLSHVTDLPCFNTSWYLRVPDTPNGQIQYYQTSGGQYYTTKGGETWYTTGIGKPIPILNAEKVNEDITMVKTYTYQGNTLYCKPFQQNNQKKLLPIKQPLINFLTSIFKIKNGQKKYFNYRKNELNEFSVNLNDYNLRNFMKIGNYFEIKHGTGFIDDKENTDFVLMTPYCGTIPESINLLSTLLSYKLIEITNKTCSLKNYVRNLTLYANKIMMGYIRNLIKTICNDNNLSMDNPDEKKMVLFLIKYINQQQPFVLTLFQNWFLNQFENTNIYALQLSVKITFLLVYVQKRVKSFNLSVNEDILNMLYKVIWDNFIEKNKITVKQINSLFKKLVNGNNLFENEMCVIIKKWFGIIDNTTDFVDLMHIEIGTQTMSNVELYNASTCPKSPLYYKNLLELQFKVHSVKIKLHEYVISAASQIIENDSQKLSKDQQLQIIENALIARAKRLIP